MTVQVFIKHWSFTSSGLIEGFKNPQDFVVIPADVQPFVFSKAAFRLKRYLNEFKGSKNGQGSRDRKIGRAKEFWSLKAIRQESV